MFNKLKKLNIFKKKKKLGKTSIVDNYILEQLEELKIDLNKDNLQVKKDLYHLLKYFNKSPFLYLLTDYNNNIIKFNNKLNEVINNKNNKLLGKNITLYFHEDDVDIFNNFLNNLKSDETIIIRIISNDGYLYYINWYGIKLEDEQKYLLFGQDITYEIELENRIKNAINYKNIILDNYLGSIICLDKCGKILEFNRNSEKLSLYEKKDVYYKHIYEIFPDKNLFNVKNIENIYKTVIKKKNGRKQNVYLQTTPLYDNSKQIGYIIIFHDQKFINNLKKIL
mgnify:CR=1 FL=1